MFRLFGFPVHVRPGFVMFMVLIVVLYGNEFGIWLAGSLAAFTLLHELGHAVAARRAGARAEISLNFLAGYASFVPTRPLSRAEHAWISFSGPGIQIAASLALLVAMGANPLEPSTLDDSAARYAIWWAGPVIGLFNLVPILPLDGGNIVMTGLDRLLPEGRAERLMIWFSLGVTAAVTVLAFSNDRYRGLILVIGFLLLTQLQPDRPPQPVTLSPAEVAELIELLPDPLPTGDPWNEYVLANQLMRIGRFEDAAHYAADAYRRHPHTLAAATVARAAGALGDQATAIGWLRTAADAGTSPTGLATVIDDSPELIGVRQHPDVVRIRRTLVTAPIA